MKGGLKHFLAEAVAVKRATRVTARNFILLSVLECYFGEVCEFIMEMRGENGKKDSLK
jgi:hypothetical protein